MLIIGIVFTFIYLQLYMCLRNKGKLSPAISAGAGVFICTLQKCAEMFAVSAVIAAVQTFYLCCEIWA